jgi:hypothetical protein
MACSALLLGCKRSTTPNAPLNDPTQRQKRKAHIYVLPSAPPATINHRTLECSPLPPALAVQVRLVLCHIVAALLHAACKMPNHRCEPV